MDAMGMGLCVAFIAFVRLPSLKVSTLLLLGLLIYDVFWVFFSSFIFNSNVMVRVATRPAENPVGIMARKFHMTAFNGKDGVGPPKLSLPGKLVFPSMNHSGHFSMLGLGDVVSNFTPFQLPFSLYLMYVTRCIMHMSFFHSYSSSLIRLHLFWMHDVSLIILQLK